MSMIYLELAWLTYRKIALVYDGFLVEFSDGLALQDQCRMAREREKIIATAERVAMNARMDS